MSQQKQKVKLENIVYSGKEIKNMTNREVLIMVGHKQMRYHLTGDEKFNNETARVWEIYDRVRPPRYKPLNLNEINGDYLK